MKNALNPFLNKQIGRRTGKDIKAGKKIRMLEGGFENFDDYWSESGQLHCGIVFFLTTANTQTHVYVWVSTYWHADFARMHEFQPSASALTRVHMHACTQHTTHTYTDTHNCMHMCSNFYTYKHACTCTDQGCCFQVPSVYFNHPSQASSSIKAHSFKNKKQI